MSSLNFCMDSLMRKYDPFQPVYAILIPEYNVSNYFEKSPD